MKKVPGDFDKPPGQTSQYWMNDEMNALFSDKRPPLSRLNACLLRRTEDQPQ
jgi:hypothetical protein